MFMVIGIDARLQPGAERPQLFENPLTTTDARAARGGKIFLFESTVTH
jgi:hypothetical protein